MEIKYAIVGDGAVAKGNRLVSPENKKVYRDYLKKAMIEGKSRQIHALWCPNSEEHFNSLWPTLTVSQPDVIFIWFWLRNPASFENVRAKWYPEVSHHCPNTPIILVGTELDVSDDSKEKLDRKLAPITYSQGLAMAKEIGAVKYLECPILALECMKNVFGEAVRVVYPQPKPKRKQCLCALM
ncbi:unnamed protein product [Medioppia subpectinata]|uniref:Uncharacterized protein n=1 Tax=Medioppia subpectinata TaxID=1979941 RepID=A0A7R9PX21_9ACAR|nr:unnamed protein product [Medioppia subpectinata]CAG2104332.1 unnamed protein product [Medioppia subpectinata]